MTTSSAPWELRPLGSTGLLVSPVCMGGGPLGSMPENFGYEVPAERATTTVRRFLEGPLNFLDTSAGYSAGESERRIGVALAEVGGVPDHVVLATKVDPDGEDYSAAAVRRSFEGSLRRLGVDRVPLLHLHDPERIPFEQATAPGGPLDELVRIRDEGLAGALGVAGGPVDLMARYLRTGHFQALVTHNRWTLVDRSANALIDEAVSLGVGVINGAPFGGGILAKGTGVYSTYAYRPASAETLRRIREMERACAQQGVPLAAAALQFSLRDPRVTSTIVGISRPERIDETVRNATVGIPDELWDQLDALASPSEEWQW